jgi:hypothetical protein
MSKLTLSSSLSSLIVSNELSRMFKELTNSEDFFLRNALVFLLTY